MMYYQGNLPFESSIKRCWKISSAEDVRAEKCGHKKSHFFLVNFFEELKMWSSWYWQQIEVNETTAWSKNYKIQIIKQFV